MKKLSVLFLLMGAVVSTEGVAAYSKCPLHFEERGYDPNDQTMLTGVALNSRRETVECVYLDFGGDRRYFLKKDYDDLWPAVPYDNHVWSETPQGPVCMTGAQHEHVYNEARAREAQDHCKFRKI